MPVSVSVFTLHMERQIAYLLGINLWHDTIVIILWVVVAVISGWSVCRMLLTNLYSVLLVQSIHSVEDDDVRTAVVVVVDYDGNDWNGQR